MKTLKIIFNPLFFTSFGKNESVLSKNTIIASSNLKKIAFLLVLFLCQVSGMSQITYTDIVPDASFAIVTGSSPTGLIPLDLDADGVVDIDFRYVAVSSIEYYLHVVPRLSNEILMNSTQNQYQVNYVEPVGSGQSIGGTVAGSNLWGTVDTRGPLLMDNALQNFATDSDIFIAVRINKGLGNWKYSWVKVNLSTLSPYTLVVKDYGTENTLNSPLLAGEKQGLLLTAQTSELKIDFLNYDNLPIAPSTDKNFYVGSTISRNLFISNTSSTGNNLNGYAKINITPGLSFSTNVKFNGISSLSNYQVVNASGGSSVVTALNNGAAWNLISGQKNWIIIKLNSLGGFNNNVNVIELLQTDNVTSCLIKDNQSKVEVSYLNQITIPESIDFNTIYDFREPIVQQGEINTIRFDSFQNTRQSWGANFNEESFQCSGRTPIRIGYNFFPRPHPAYTDFVFGNSILKIGNQMGELFRIDMNSIVITKTSTSGVTTYIVPQDGTIFLNSDPSYYDNYDVSTGNIVPNQGDRFDRIEVPIGDINYSDVIRVEYDVYYCCKKEGLFDDYIRPSSSRSVYISYDHECDPLDGGRYELSAQSGHGWNALLAFKADVFSAPTIMAGPNPSKSYPDVANFVIEQPRLDGMFGAFYGGSSFPHDFISSYIKVRIKTGAGLRYSAYEEGNTAVTLNAYSNEYPHGSNPMGIQYTNSIRFINQGNFQNWLPVDWRGTQQTVPGYSYVRDFVFKISDIPGVQAVINHPTYTYNDKLNTINSLLEESLNKSKLWYTLESICAGDDGRFEIEYYFNTGLNCTTSCDMPLTKTGDNVQVNCPGCRVPGAAVNGGKIQRLNYGPYFNDLSGTLSAGETDASTHTLAEITGYNSSRQPAEQLVTNNVIANDGIQITSHFNLTGLTDCNMLKASCSAADLKYKFAYLQVGIPKKITQNSAGIPVSIVDPSISSINIRYNGVMLTSSQFHWEYYGSGQSDIFYFKISADAITSGLIFTSPAQFDFSFETKIIGNVTKKEKLSASYMGYFTIDEESIASLIADGRLNLYNRHYADCTNDNPGFKDGNIPETCGFTDGDLVESGVAVFYTTAQKRRFQMICENWAATVNLYPIITGSGGLNTGLYSNRKRCSSNIVGPYLDYVSTIGNRANNFFPNELRQAPKLRTLNINVPKHYQIEEIYLKTTRNLIIHPFDPNSPANFTVSEKAANDATTTDRIVVVDLERFWLNNVTSLDPNAPAIGWLDENFQIYNFNIKLRAVCTELESAAITSTPLGGLSSAFAINSTNEYDNPFISNNGVLDFAVPLDQNENYTPIYTTTTTPSLLFLTPNGANASGSRFTAITQSSFSRQVDIQGQLAFTNPESYDGNIFLAIDKIKVAQNFKKLIISYNNTVLVNYDASVTANNDEYWGLMNINTWDKFTLKVEGELNMSTIADCNNPNKILPLELLYGIHCQEEDITYASIVNSTLCNNWKGLIEFDVSNVSLNTNITPTTTPDATLSGNNRGVAIFTASAEQLNELEVKFTNPIGISTEIESIDIFSGNNLLRTLNSNEYNFNSLNSTTNELIIDTRNGTNIFNSNGIWKAQNLATTGEIFYNEIRVNYRLLINSCQKSPFTTNITYAATPFYSESQCKLTGAKNVTSNFNFIYNNSIINNDLNYCQNSGDKPLLGSPSGGVWYINNVSSPTGILNSSVSGSYIIRYTTEEVTSTLSISCPASTEKTITIIPSPTISAGPDLAVCKGTTLTLTATGAVTYLWSTGANTAAISVKPGVQTSYTVTGTAANGCVNKDTVTVSVNPIPVVAIVGFSSSYCKSTVPVVLTATPAGGVFSGKHVSAGTYVPSVVGKDTVFYTYTSAAGCIGNTFATTTVLPTPVLVLNGDTAYCQNELIIRSVTVSGVAAPYTYQWYTKTGAVKTNLLGQTTSTLNGVSIYTAGIYGVTVTGGGCSSSIETPLSLKDASVCCKYKIEDVSSVCASTSKFCVSLTAKIPVDTGIIGMDYCLSYNPLHMKPTGNATLGSVVTTTSALGGYYIFDDATSGRVHVSIYYKSAAAKGTYFKGKGEVICIEFTPTAGLAAGVVDTLKACELQEAYTLSEKAGCWKPGVFKVTASPSLNGELRYMNTTKVLGYTAGNLPTNIYAAEDNCDSIATSRKRADGNGQFVLPLLGKNNLRLVRDIPNTYTPSTGTATTTNFRFMRYVNGLDANKVGQITTLNNTFVPDGLQITAADVNMNGRVRANDITLMQQRTVAIIKEYPQSWNYNSVTNVWDATKGVSLDWRFIDKTSYDSTRKFKPSSKVPNPYPKSDTIGFSRDDLPKIPFCLTAKKQCALDPRELYYGILLGDVTDLAGTDPITGKASKQYPNSGDSRVRMSSTEAVAYMTLDLGGAKYLGNNTYEVPLAHTVPSQDTLVSIDFGMNYDESKLDIQEVTYSIDYKDNINMLWNDYMDSELLLTSYTLEKMSTSGSYYSIQMRKADGTAITKADIGSTIGLLNGYEVEVRFSAAVTPVKDAEFLNVAPHLWVVPTPARGLSTIEYALMNKSKTNRVVITNAIGQVVRTYNDLPELGTIAFDADELASGLYFCTAYGEDAAMQVTKFTVIK